MFSGKLVLISIFPYVSFISVVVHILLAEVAQVAKFCVVVHNICVLLVCNLFHDTL